MNEQGGLKAMFNFSRGPKAEAEGSEETQEDEVIETQENDASTSEKEGGGTEETIKETETVKAELDSNRALLVKIGGLEEQINSLRESAKEETSVQEVLPEVEVGSFLSEEVAEALGDVFSDDQLKAVDALLGSVYKKARVDSMRDIPALMERSFSRKTTEQTAIADFWNDNPDIADLSQNESALGVMKSVVMRIQSENPNLSTRAALDQMGEEVRGAFALESKVKEVVKEASKKRRSNFAKPPRKGRSPASTEELNEQQQQLAEMFEHVEQGG